MPTARPERKPNILIIMADQLGAAALPAYGNRVAKAPHIDALAETGVIFANAYCNSPLCGPSRYVFMSGRMPSAIGAYDNAVEFQATLPTFAHHLRNAGYRTILSGKMHFCGPDQMHGFEERLTTDIYPADFGWTPDWSDFDTRPDWYHDMSSVRDAGLCVRTNQMDFDDEVIFSARRKLFDLARDDDDRPFCMVVSLTHPHDPFAMTEEYWNRYKPVEIDMPRIRPAAADLDPHSRRLRYVSNMDREPVSEDNIRDARHAYYAAISYVDDQIGFLLDTMRQCGLMERTVTMVTADHGEMLGEHSLWYKMTFFENACRIPLIVHAPGRFLPATVTASVSSVDILPTLVDIAQGGRTLDYGVPVDGRSLLAHLSGDDGHDGVFGEYMGEGAVAPIVMIRRGAFKFIHSPADPDQLFDLRADPDEVVNLAHSPDHAELVAAFRNEVGHRWDLPAIHADVLASQKRRRFINDALRKGRYRHWDFQPVTDASEQYMRNHLKLGELESRARFPKVTKT
ncbi:choline-sulfatase [Acidiphilium sp. AL]|uniref:choline-sulfatase n=1 Tax=Acidiphilium sp. AL TaxID=2871704 RepID=UPI0021CB763E|nr:choline-sulfatase [Acidiphilium sp. AL]